MQSLRRRTSELTGLRPATWGSGSASTAAPVELFLLRALEPLVDNRGICRQRNAVQINDSAVNNQLNVSFICWVFCLIRGRTMDDDTCFDLLAQKKVRTTHQAHGRPFACHLQEMRPGRL